MYGFHRPLNIEKNNNMSTGNGFYIQDCEKKSDESFYYIFRTVELLSLYCIYNMSNTNVRAL